VSQLAHSTGGIRTNCREFRRPQTDTHDAKAHMIAPARHTNRPAPPNPNEHFVLRTVAVVRRHAKRSAIFFAVAMTLVVVGVLVAPKTYRSRAKLFVRMGRESVTLDPTATTGKVMSVYESRENEINSIMEVIQSRVLLERVVDRLGPKTILSGKLGAAAPGAISSQPAEPSPGREKAVRILERTVRISHAKKSAVIRVECKAGSPKLAQRIVQEVLDGFRELHVNANRTAGSREFFANQKELIGKQLAAATREYREAKNRLGMSSIEDQRKTLQELIRNNRTAAQANDAELVGIAATIVSLKQTLADLPKTLVAARVVGSPNSAADRARQQLNELLVRRRQLLTTFTVHHPDVITVDEQIAAAKSIVEQNGRGDEQATTATNPTTQALQVRLLTGQARAKSLKSKSAELGAQHAALLTQRKTLNDHEGRLTQLRQEVDRLQVAHRVYSEKFEQARIDWALGEQHISNVNVVQPPTFVTKPVSPKKRIVVFLGLVVAAIGAVGFAWLTEIRQRRRDDDDEVTAVVPRRDAVPTMIV
jgi:uncharacterized protein involved in exopolysaccharide biosynthesis